MDGDPKSLLTQFRNDYYPRIAVTVDMIATGTDVKPLECLVFMRDVRSRNYFEQMKGRSTRTLDHDDLRKVTPSAATAKTHFVIVDAVGVTKSVKTDSGPLISKPGVPLTDLAMGVMMGARDEETISSLAGRLARLNRQLDDGERRRIEEQAGGVELTDIVGNLLAAIDPDRIEAKAREIDPRIGDDDPAPATVAEARDLLAANATDVLTGDLIDLIDSIRRVIDELNEALAGLWDCGAELPSGWALTPIESVIPHDGLFSDGDWVQSILKTAFNGQLVSQAPNDEPALVLLDRIKASESR